MHQTYVFNINLYIVKTDYSSLQARQTKYFSTEKTCKNRAGTEIELALLREQKDWNLYVVTYGPWSVQYNTKYI